MDAIIADGLVKVYRSRGATPTRPSRTASPALVTILWVLVFIAIFAPLGTRRYRSMSR
jgi:hypothetical protein